MSRPRICPDAQLPLRRAASVAGTRRAGAAAAGGAGAAAAGADPWMAADPQQQQQRVHGGDQEIDRYSFDDSDRFEEDSLCSWSSEPESLCNNWRGWKRPTANNATSGAGNFLYGSSSTGGGGMGYFQATGTSGSGAAQTSSAAGGGTSASAAAAAACLANGSSGGGSGSSSLVRRTSDGESFLCVVAHYVFKFEFFVSEERRSGDKRVCLVFMCSAVCTCSLGALFMLRNARVETSSAYARLLRFSADVFFF